jgi:LEA14-like dessication related protein
MLFVSFCLTCKSPPEPAPAAPVPVVRLVFDRIEAEDQNHLFLWFNLEAENPRGEGVTFSFANWKAVFNGSARNTGVGFFADGGTLRSGERRIVPVRVAVDGEGLIAEARKNNGDCESLLSVDLVFSCPSDGENTVAVEASAVFPLIREPLFNILAIKVKKAELINTRFNVKVRLDNPNIFPVELSSFSYELYGGGRFWADGDEKGLVVIPQGESAVTDLNLTMNFIDMRRSLLDQVIAGKEVDYRFSGEAVVNTGIAYLPNFRWKFDQSGRSEVVD